MLVADGYDEAVLGVARRCSQPDLFAYDVEKIIEILMTRDDMTYEDAVEFFDFNIAGAWVGEETPIFIFKMTIEEVTACICRKIPWNRPSTSTAKSAARASIQRTTGASATIA